MNTKLILIFFFLTFSINSFSQETEWIYIAKDKDGDKWNVKSEYVLKSGSTIKIWIKIDFKKKNITKGSKNVTIVNGKQLHLAEFDCDESKMKLISSYIYNSSGSVVKTIKIDEENQEWIDVVPETIGYQVWEKICELFN